MRSHNRPHPFQRLLVFAMLLGLLGVAFGSSADAAPAAAAGGAKNCKNLKATDQGVTPKAIQLAAVVVQYGGGISNEVVNSPPGDTMGQMFQAYADAINEDGGAACRDIEVKYYLLNPLDQNEQRALCLQIADTKPFAVLDAGGYQDPANRACFMRAKIPYQNIVPINADEAQAAYPYMYSSANSNEGNVQNWVFESAARGAFDKDDGFEKLGLLSNTCSPKSTALLKKNLNKVGVKSSQISDFTLSGCAVLASGDSIGQAVQQHKNDGVTDVFFGSNPADDQTYVRQADALGFKPRYHVSDFQNVTTSIIANTWPEGFDGARGVSGARTGEQGSGVVDPLVTQCNEWLAAKDLPGSESDLDSAPLSICDQMRLFAAAADAAGPNLKRSTLVKALQKVGRLDYALAGVGIYDKAKDVFGGDYVRAVEWNLDCTCWKIVDQKLRPARQTA